MGKMIIIAIRYLEPDWKKTLTSIISTGFPFIVVDRKPSGIGSLAAAVNRGVQLAGDHQYAWIVTNIQFDQHVPSLLLNSAMAAGFAALQPCYKSDHAALCPQEKDNRMHDIFFPEFTCPLVKISLLKEFPLDEQMPYWGHDLDWGKRVRDAGYKIGVHRGIKVDHTYIRFSSPHPVTLTRKAERISKNKSTTKALIAKYGLQWKQVLNYK